MFPLFHRFFFIFSLCLLSSSPATAAEAKIAVASNFYRCAQQIIEVYEQKSPHKITLIPGSTGKLYAQIHHGAPFHAFLSADALRPQQLEKNNLAQKNSRFTYATGQLVLWSPGKLHVDANGTVLSTGKFRFLALANPRLAPYGKAAQQVLEKKGLWRQLQSRIVRGENVNQSFQYITSGNAQLGFISLSQLKLNKNIDKGSFWLIPQNHYTPIHQQAILLKDNPAAADFLNFLQKKPATQIIKQHGYLLPDAK